MREFYVLRHGEIVPASLQEWAMSLETRQNVIQQDYVGDIFVSTVFLGVSYGGPYFETMIFGGKHNDYQERCYTLEEAKAQHENALMLAREEPDAEA